MLTSIVALALIDQEVPKDVRYAKVDAKTNTIAQKKLQAVFGKEPTMADYSPIAHSPTIVGPRLWSAIKKAALKDMPKSKPVTFNVPNGKAVHKYDGRLLKEAPEIELLWLSISIIAEKGSKASVRKAKASELSYYWAIISYDIVEPLYVVDCGKSKFLFHFDESKTSPRPFFIEMLP